MSVCKITSTNMQEKYKCLFMFFAVASFVFFSFLKRKIVQTKYCANNSNKANFAKFK